MNLEAVTPLIITRNEMPNLVRTLGSLSWASQMVVVDSGSTDGTKELLSGRRGLRLVERPFDSFAEQCNAGLRFVATEWVLSLDADYVCTAELIDEIASLPDNPPQHGFAASFEYWIHGRPLRSSLYPPRVVLHRTADAHYENDGHGHRVVVNGDLASLKGVIRHDDRKPLDAWIEAQNRYARAEADKLLSAAPRALMPIDRLRRSAVLAPLVVLFYCLIGRGLILDGWRGWFYSFQRTYAELLLALQLLERRGQKELLDASRSSA